MKFLISSQDELQDIATKLITFAAETPNKTLVWVLEGAMGAGKTTFSKFICQELQVIDDVSSPTFAIVNEYATKNGDTVYHLDCYRLENEDEALAIGIEEYLYAGCVCLIEWAEKIQNIINHVPFIKIQIEVISVNERIITFSNHERNL